MRWRPSWGARVRQYGAAVDGAVCSAVQLRGAGERHQGMRDVSRKATMCWRRSTEQSDDVKQGAQGWGGVVIDEVMF